MAKKYPRIGEILKIYPKGLCIVCGEGKANTRIDVEVNWFRGDDEIYKAHKKCIVGLGNNELLKAIEEYNYQKMLTSQREKEK